MSSELPLITLQNYEAAVTLNTLQDRIKQSIPLAGLMHARWAVSEKQEMKSGWTEMERWLHMGRSGRVPPAIPPGVILPPKSFDPSLE